MLAVFIGLHLLNHLYSVAGPDQHIAFMKVLRLFYRNVLVEAVLLMAVLLQIVSGIKLFKNNSKATVSNFDKLHRWTGLYLAAFFVIHVGSVLAGRTVLHLDTNFYYEIGRAHV